MTTPLENEKVLVSQASVNSFARQPEEHLETMTKEDLENEKAVEKKLVRILDYRLLIWSFFGYFANGLDRNNMPNAYTSGMPEELNLQQYEYNWAVTLFFIGYVTLQIPCNAIITRVRPSIMLPFIMFLWGAVVCFMALVKDYRGLYGLRICLGISEAAFYPGIVYLLGSWYTKQELGARTAVFVAGSQISGAFSGIISGAISTTLDGHNGMRGWKWLFIIEGLIAVFISIFGFFVLPDMPNNTKFITGELRELALKRLRREGKETVVSGLNWVTFRNLFGSPYILIYIMVFSIMQLGMGILQQFPIILKQMGYPTYFANYMQAPLWIFAGIIIITQGFLSDYKGARVWHIVGGGLWTLFWYIIMVAVNGGNLPVPLLFVCTFMAVPVLGISPIMMTWLNEFYSADMETRALAIAMTNSIGNLAPNFANVKLWYVEDAPAFRLGKIATMSLLAAMIVLVTVMYALQRAGWLLPKPARKIETETIVSDKVSNERDDGFA
ncbi:major facilitator superfamily domain-containing protein [Halteromyces radiatus]|uniref:major facilitator superfamily domain-containing protein n=1 Tax=Halteromyces radiatus TaxID=101107 RepID=UPI00221E4AD1|nr:major facilitator superfamily domain-containing protein [Halteromyces radiatus]KAI8099855.1 major facilitator superfamily domain-containing protein [Halteromyces radiatus]